MREYEEPKISIITFCKEEILGESIPWTELPKDEFDENEEF